MTTAEVTKAAMELPSVEREAMAYAEPGFMVIGGVAQDWRLQRVLATIRLVDPLPFLDVEAQESGASRRRLSEPLISG
ncbi:MAG: hypothetical protein QM638_23315 [Nocardioides sp.]|uniref:hypothetical protein n=1 Tax=Nocardioides sp. TaxID=35761 RepID=UPI0039E5F12B